MKKAVLDSNVLVSAIYRPESVPGQVLQRGHQQAYELWLSRGILRETRKTLRDRPFFAKQITDEQRERFLKALRRAFPTVQRIRRGRYVPRDRKDDHVVGAALAAEADYLVTGNVRHLIVLDPLEARGQVIRIISPRDFLDLLEETEE